MRANITFYPKDRAQEILSEDYKKCINAKKNQESKEKGCIFKLVPGMKPPTEVLIPRSLLKDREKLELLFEKIRVNHKNNLLKAKYSKISNEF